MKFKVRVSPIYECSLERAFKTPMLCDVKKVHAEVWLTMRNLINMNKPKPPALIIQ